MSYRVAMIGCGNRALGHVPGLLAEARCRVVALVDVNPEAAQKVRDQGFKDAAYYNDHRLMLEKEKPDAVVLCLWTPLHLPVFADCLAAGVKLVLSEKPMAPTWGETRRMAQLAEQSSCHLHFCHQRRFATGNRLVRQWISEGRIGKVERMDLYSPQHLLDCGTHTIDQAMSFNAESPCKWVLGAVDASKLVTYFNVSAEVQAVGMLVFQNGVRASLNVGGPDLDMGGGVRVVGSEGFIEVLWEGVIKRAVRYAEPGWSPTLPEKETHAQQITRYVHQAFDGLEQGHKVQQEGEVSWHKALRAAEVIFALYESVRRHARVTLPLTEVSDNPFLSMLQSGELKPQG